MGLEQKNPPEGITPACAGKRTIRAAYSKAARDHPRMRGEKGGCSRYGTSSAGSPPHARGKGAGARRGRPARGITPACAGKSSSLLSVDLGRRDHPRMRGEKYVVVSYHVLYLGSPPHARGKGPPSAAIRPQTGITPACAGKRLKRIPYLLRSCAKHLFTLQFCVDNLCQLAVGYSAVSLNIR